MADYPPRLNRSPFFRTFSNTQRIGNIVRKNHMIHAGSKEAGEAGSLQFYSMPPIRQVTQNLMPQQMTQMASQPIPQQSSMQAIPQQAPMQPISQQAPMQTIPQQMPMQAIPQQMPVQAAPTVPMPHQMQNFIPQQMPAQPMSLPSMPMPEITMPAPPNPQNAAERFSQVNKGLPDGVRFEPLDEETKAALKKLGMMPQQPAKLEQPAALEQPKAPITPTVPAAPVQARMPNMPPGGPLHVNNPVSPGQAPPPRTGPTPPRPQTQPQNQPQHSSESVPILERLIQDERNAAVYYGYLSEIAPTEEHKNTLHIIANGCEGRRGQYQQLLHNMHSRTFEPRESEINTAVSFEQGMRIAVSEERKILEAMADLIDKLESSGSSARAVQNMINKRMIQLNWLQWTMFRQSEEI